MYQSVIFDLDGTLLNTIEDLADAGNWVCRRNGWPEHPVEDYMAMVGRGIPNLVLQFSPEHHRSPLLLLNTVSQFNDYYGQHNMDKTGPYAGVPELLDRLCRAGVKMAVFSNKADDFSRRIVEHFFPGVFQVVRGNLPNVPLKPDPAGTRAVLSALGGEPGQTLYVGDSDVDVQTGHNAGLEVCGVTWGFRTRDTLAAAGAETLVDTPEALGDFILG